MSYQTGTATSTSDALTQLATFASTYAGYTVSTGHTMTSADNGVAWDGLVGQKFSKAGYATIHMVYLSGLVTEYGTATHCPNGMLRAYIDSTGADAAWPAATTYLSGDRSSYTCPESCVAPMDGCTKYHFFTNGNEVYVSLKLGNNGWTHFGFGVLGFKAGSWTGGTFFAPCHQNTHGSGVEPESDYVGWFFGGRFTINSSNQRRRGNMAIYHIENGSRKYGWSSSIAGVAPSSGNQTYITDVCAPHFASVDNLSMTLGKLRTTSQFNGRSRGAAADLFGFDPSLAVWRYIGQAQGIRLICIEHLVEEEVINGDWVVFPLGNRTTETWGYCMKTENFGVAFKKYT